MAETKLIIPRLSDETIINWAKEIVHHFESKSASCQIRAQGLINYHEPFSNGKLSENSKVIIKQNTAIIEQIIISISPSSIILYRGGKPETKSPIFDEVVFIENHQNQTPLTNEEKLWFIVTTTKHLKPFDPNRQTSSLITPEQQALQAFHHETLERLEKLNEKLVKETQEFRQTLDEEFSAKRIKLEQELDNQRKQLESSYQFKQDELQRQKDLLDKLKREVDDRSNTHARREIRKDILLEIQNRTNKFELTKYTRNLRNPIAISIIFLVLFLGAGAVQTTIEFIDAAKAEHINMTLIYSLSIRQLLFSFGAGGSLIYFIRWLNRWFEQHAQAEFQLKQFQLDIERASWIVETTLEWNDAKGTTIPDKLLESLSRNLFSDATQPPEQAVHPADQLASALLGSASSIKLKAGDSEISIDPKKLDKTSKNEKAAGK